VAGDEGEAEVGAVAAAEAAGVGGDAADVDFAGGGGELAGGGFAVNLGFSFGEHGQVG